MLSKEELKAKNTQFWGDFKKHMHAFRSSNGRRMNWLAYPTEISDFYLRMKVDKNEVSLNFDIQCKDSGVRAIFWEQLNELKAVLTEAMDGDAGIWHDELSNAFVKSYSSIQWKKEDLNYLNPSHQDAIFDFFEKKLKGFDLFYQEYKDILLYLAE